MIKKTKLIVIGLDGGTWNIIKPLVNAGRLPTIEKLMKNGTYGDLESSIPHTTFPAWKCYSTGKNPGKLGVYDFNYIDFKNRKIKYNDSYSFKSKEIWDHLNNKKIICGVCYMPTMYPPKKINGFVISEMFASNNNFAFPKKLEKELKNKFKYKISSEYVPVLNKDWYIVYIKNFIKKRFEVAKYLIKKFEPNFFHITIFNLDTVQHFYWKYINDKNSKYRNVIEDILVNIDSEVKKMMDSFENDIYVILMSDHGFTKAKYTFYLTKWLIKNNYLFLNKNINQKILIFINKVNLSNNTLFLLTKKIWEYKLFRKIIPLNLARKIFFNLFPLKEGDRPFTSFDNLIDWKRSKVIPSAHGNLYINKGIISNREYNIIRNLLIKSIKKIKYLKKNKNLTKAVYKKEEIYKGNYLNLAPDIIILQNEGIGINVNYYSSENMWGLSHKVWSGTHKLHGIFCISGPGVKKNKEIINAKIIDLAPTILHLFNVPIPNDMDGRVLTECFKRDSELAKREIVYEKSEERFRLKNKIKELKIKGKI